MTPRRRGLDDHLAFVGANAQLTFAEGVADGFVFLAHNHLRCLQLVILAPVGDVIRRQGKLCFSSSAKPLCLRGKATRSKTYMFCAQDVYVSLGKAIRLASLPSRLAIPNELHSV